jgi:hypothetical protein
MCVGVKQKVSNDLIYWVYLGFICIVPFIIGIWLMKKTDRLSYSFWLSTIVNVVLTGAGVLWWQAVNVDAFRIIFGEVFYAIACVNVAVLEFFALISIRKKSNS